MGYAQDVSNIMRCDSGRPGHHIYIIISKKSRPRMRLFCVRCFLPIGTFIFLGMDNRLGLLLKAGMARQQCVTFFLLVPNYKRSLSSHATFTTISPFTDRHPKPTLLSFLCFHFLSLPSLPTMAVYRTKKEYFIFILFVCIAAFSYYKSSAYSFEVRLTIPSLALYEYI